MLNAVLIDGNLGADFPNRPAVQTFETKNGRMVTFAIATRDDFGRTTWIDVLTFERTPVAFAAASQLSAGQAVSIVGRLAGRKVEGDAKDGKARTYHSIIAEKVEPQGVQNDLMAELAARLAPANEQVAA